VRFISNGLHHGSVLVHCQRGVSRSATSVIMFLMRKANMTMNQSLKLCQRRRPIVDPNSAFMNQLRIFEGECREGGHLTSVDIQDVVVGVNEKDTNDSFGKNGMESGVRNDIGPSVGGAKRKGESVGCGNDGRKKRAVGPIGPSRAPAAAIGPAMPPSKEGAINNLGPSAGGDKKRVKNVGCDNIIRKQRTVGPIGPSRGPVNSAAAIGPAMPPPDRVPNEKK